MEIHRPRAFSFVLSAAAWILLAALTAQAFPVNAQSSQERHSPGTSRPPDPLLPDKPDSDGRRWAGSIRMGLSWESGVNDRLGLHLSGTALGSFGKTSLLFEYGYLFGEQRLCAEICLEQTVSNDLFGRFSYERRFDGRFSFLSRSSYERDTVQQLHFRVDEHLGLGIALVSSDRVFLQVAPGFILAQEDKNLVIDDGFDTGLGNLQFFRWAINAGWIFTQSSTAQWHFGSADDYMLEAHAGLTGLINKHWAVNIALLYDHENLVLEGRQKKDQKMTVGLQFHF